MRKQLYCSTLNKAAKVSDIAHRYEHHAHLIYFGTIWMHADYKTAALGCLLLGVVALGHRTLARFRTDGAADAE